MEENVKKGSTFKKICISCLCGLLFGLFAALTMFAVSEVKNVLDVVLEQKLADADTADADADAVEDKEVQLSETETKDTSGQQTLNTAVATTVVTDVTEVVEKTMPAIVSITNSYTYSYYYYSTQAESKGSGIIVGSNDTELLIATNYHVIEDYDELTVTFCDETTATAQIKGSDSAMDLAVLAVNIDDLEVGTESNIAIATLGDSDTLKVGEPAIAIGNALGYGQSVTTGVISAVNREMDMNDDGNTRTFIQTDAAINGGNSGGALLNINGEVIGINSNKIGGSAVEGMGYAIPISAARPIIEELMMKETRTLVDEDEQACLGITGATVSTTEASKYGYPSGVYVANVYKDSAASEAGIEKGDFIYSFDGDSITSMEQLQRVLKYYKVGETVEVKVYRYGNGEYEEITLNVTLGGRDIFNS